MFDKYHFSKGFVKLSREDFNTICKPPYVTRDNIKSFVGLSKDMEIKYFHVLNMLKHIVKIKCDSGKPNDVAEYIFAIKNIKDFIFACYYRVAYKALCRSSAYYKSDYIESKSGLLSICVCKCMDRFQYDKNIRFSTYLYNSMLNEASKLFKKSSKSVDNKLSGPGFMCEIPDKIRSRKHTAIDDMEKIHIGEIKEHLQYIATTKTDIDVLTKLFSDEGENKRTFKDIADEIGCHRQTVANIINKYINITKEIVYGRECK